MSKTMLERAVQRRSRMPHEVAALLSFEEGDVRTYRRDEIFDVVISLFHVFSYQISNDDLVSAFATAAAHLRPGGILIFDYWYGPSVLSTQPEVRVKRLEDEQIKALRIAEPVLYPNENRVQVNYTVQIENKAGGGREEIRECHDMRYLFLPEIEQISRELFTPRKHLAWMTTHPPNTGDWAGVSILERIN
jgi:SAM-dependent methyltransferase